MKRLPEKMAKAMLGEDAAYLITKRGGLTIQDVCNLTLVSKTFRAEFQPLLRDLRKATRAIKDLAFDMVLATKASTDTRKVATLEVEVDTNQYGRPIHGIRYVTLTMEATATDSGEEEVYEFTASAHLLRRDLNIGFSRGDIAIQANQLGKVFEVLNHLDRLLQAAEQ